MNLNIQQLMQMASGNPMMAQAWKLMQNNDTKGLENMARQVAKEKGLDIDTLMQQVKGLYPR